MELQRAVTLIALAGLLVARGAGAQYQSSAGLERVAAPDAQWHMSVTPAVMVDGSRLAGAAHGALIGAGVGAGVGIIVMALTPHSDHSEDAMGYIVGAAGGAFFGLIIGAAIGSAHPR